MEGRGKKTNRRVMTLDVLWRSELGKNVLRENLPKLDSHLVCSTRRRDRQEGDKIGKPRLAYVCERCRDERG